MNAALVVGVALSVFVASNSARAECPSTSEFAVSCGPVAFVLASSDRDESGHLHALGALGVLPDGRVLEAAELHTSCAGECRLEGVNVSGTAGTWTGDELVITAGHLTGDGIHVDFGEEPRAGVAGVSIRWIDQRLAGGVSALFPLTSQRALGTRVEVGDESASVGLAAFDGDRVSSRADIVGGAVGPGFLISAAERVNLGPVHLSLDGSLGDDVGRDWTAGSLRYFGHGSEDLTLGVSTGGSGGHLALRYVSRQTDDEFTHSAHVDAIVHQSLRPFDTQTELGVSASSSANGFAPAAGAAVLVEAPFGRQRVTFVPRAGLRAVGEERSEGPTDVAGASLGAQLQLRPVWLPGIRVSVRADGEYGGELRTGGTSLEVWNAPTTGWRVGGALETAFAAAGGPRLVWSVTGAEFDESSLQHALVLQLARERASVTSTTVVVDGAWQGSMGLASVSSDGLEFYFFGGRQRPSFERPLPMGALPLRRIDDQSEVESMAAFGFSSRVGEFTVELESGYTVANLGTRGIGGRGMAAYAPVGRPWALVAEAGKFIGAGAHHASLQVRTGRNPGVSAWHRR